MVVVRDITDRKAAERALRVHSEYLEALHETTLNLVNRLDAQDLLAAIVGRAGALLGTGDGYIYVVSGHGREADERGELEVRVGTGVFAEHVGFRMHRGEGLAGRVLETGEPFSIADYDEWDGRSPNFPRGVMHAGAAVPLTSEGRVIGVLGLSHPEARGDVRRARTSTCCRGSRSWRRSRSTTRGCSRRRSRSSSNAAARRNACGSRRTCSTRSRTRSSRPTPRTASRTGTRSRRRCTAGRRRTCWGGRSGTCCRSRRRRPTR